MKLALKKEVKLGIIISLIIFCICYFVGGTGGGPCNAGIGLILDFFILVIAVLFFAVLMFVRKPSVSLTAKTVVLTLFFGSALLFIWLLYN